MGAVVIEGELRLPGVGGESVEAIVRLQDTTFADAPARLLAEARCASSAADPLRLGYQIEVQRRLLRPGRDYTLSARARVGDPGAERLFGTVQSYPWQPERCCRIDLDLKELN